MHVQRDIYDDLLDTLLHEIAHALTPGDGHGKLWQAKAMELGARPTTHKTPEELGFDEQPLRDVYAIFLNEDGVEKFYREATKNFFIKVACGKKDIKKVYYPKERERTEGNLTIRLVRSDDPALLTKAN